MSKKTALRLVTASTVFATIIMTHFLKNTAKKTIYKALIVEPILPRQMSFYEKYVKRGIDVACSAVAIVVFSPLYLGLAAMIKVKLGSPVLFVQERPGMIDKDGRETIFKMYKFRTMTDERDPKTGELLPDDIRLTRIGAWLRKTSLDELPEAFNILNGTMSVIGPRPQLVRDMVFMSNEQRMRHTAKPGLSGLAQINGRNAISWEEKLAWDLKYINKVTLTGDVKILIDTVKKAFIKQEGITQDDMATAEDFGDYLLRKQIINQETYNLKQKQARDILNREIGLNEESELVSIIMPSYNTAQYIAESIRSIQAQTYMNWELIIVDDCSTDNSLEVICSFDDPRIKLLKNERNSGAAVSRNYALREAKGKWIAFLDSDDTWASEKLEKQIKFMKKNDYSFTFTDYRICLNGAWMPYINTGPNIVTKKIMYDYCYFSTITVMYDRDKIGLIQIADLRKNNDYAMWLQAIEKSNAYRLPECLSYYIKHEGSVSSGSKAKLIKWHYRLFRDGLGKGPVVSTLLTANNMVHGVWKKIYYKEAIKNYKSIKENNNGTI